MKGICNVKEFTGDESFLSVKELISENAIPEKDRILQFLKSFQPDCAAGMTLIDEVNGKDTNLSVNGYEDNEYYWDTRYIYHFEKYNLKLNDDFVNYVLEK